MSNTLDVFAKFLLEQGRSQTTVRGYLVDMKGFFTWLGETPLEQITAGEVRAYRQHLLDTDAAAQTINRKLAAIAAFGNWAVQAGILIKNPALNVKSVKVDPLAPKWLDRKQRSALVQAAKDDLEHSRQRYPRLWALRLRDAASVTLLLNTGLRVSELCALKLSDLLLTERKATITVRAGKGTKQRVLPLNREARQMLEEWLEVRPEESGDALFASQRSEQMQTRSVQLAVSRLANDAGLVDVTPNVLRHTFAKSLLENGVTMEKVAALLGHESLDTTRLYFAPSERDLERAVEVLIDESESL